MASGESIIRYLKSNRCFKGLECHLHFIDENLNLETFTPPFACVFNTLSKYNPSYKKFAHWVCLFYDGNVEKDIIFFDSLGGPIPDELLRTVTKSGVFNSFSRVNFSIQSEQSDLCGVYVVMFLYALFCEKLSLHKFLELFSLNSIENDTRILSAYNRIFERE